MADENEQKLNDENDEASAPENDVEALSPSEEQLKADSQKKSSISETYFSNGNRLLTLPGSSLVINDDTRRLLALFSDGRF